MKRVTKATVRSVLRAIKQKKGENVLGLDLRECCDFTSFMVHATATSSPHLEALAALVQKLFKRRGTAVRSVEGTAQSEWVLIDAGDIIVHLFSPRKRAYYLLERLWGDAEIIEI